jgi:glycerol dehydrogenase
MSYSNINTNEIIPYKACFPGKYIQQEKALFLLPDYVKQLGSIAMVLASPTVNDSIINRYEFFDNPIFHIEKFGGECSEKEIERLIDIVKKEKIDIVIAMGGGKAIDTAKIVSDKERLSVIIVPTIASSDAPCSGCAVVYSDESVFQYVYFQKMNPQIVLIDMDMITDAPVRYLVAGMGDALATWFEARSCERTQSMNECGGYSTMTGQMIAKLCFDTLLKYGIAAMIACENHIVTPALHHIVEANTLLSGIGFESSGLGAAHAIHNGLTAIPSTNKFLHGEKVAFGTIASLHLTNADPKEIDEVYSFCEMVGLPTTFKDIEIEGISRDALMKVAQKATEKQESIHKEAGKMTPEKVLNAMIAADAYGRSRKIK